ncbi:FecCD family ABC transporter permease [Aneurinibacillus aneurinilyticus]|jgi:iron complex transport system permease protein|uniref:Iron ABC transporter permease n=2 Tax=Aneurinibacillus aneurinilyticus TaxID=1391 RepID=A0A848D6A2_ANEAE|nr:iron ABC transporter permease [Aneurinibacillus aneurinilyticus]ERI11041.1 putative ferrichrome transport system permease protein FhuG [Aneurinibacillus aneurinilyticus ATCC 12856]MCI1694810.1 iron ABC transporter permease [Aneurinibacillus aneurinilyticus]MED0708780.1 iron ABC transporter permease [Aneurinibacillus aneurinilyticus]MED0722763.1 iron ABC transporter permease [Aneurinibacillus aneurinilyticus]MED0733595.1 iron ABC transporter permease [Aneurinibacillus aneurinilyticus]
MIQPALIKKQRMIVCTLLVLIMTTIFISMGMGYSSLSYDRLIPTFLGQGTFKEEFILFSVRLPRIIITLLAGMALALSGSILQGITRNDLADPGILGINSGAGVAIALFFLFFPIKVGSFVYLLPLVAFGGALITAYLIYILSYNRKTGLQPVKLVLIGVGFSMALSGIMIVLISSAERSKVDFIAKWLAGNIWGTDWPFIWAIVPWLVILIPFTLYKANRLNLLGLSESVAIGVGVSIETERIVLLLAAVALAASAVSVTGGIAFIGLMAPHIAKVLVGPRNQLFIPVAILIGGWLLLFADTIGRNLVDPDGIPAGIMVALIGAPYFMYLLLRK